MVLHINSNDYFSCQLDKYTILLVVADTNTLNSVLAAKRKIFMNNSAVTSVPMNWADQFKPPY